MKTAATLLHFFDDSLWSGSVFHVRSPECSPLYVDRYDGPRLSSAQDAHAWWELTAVVDGGIRLGGKPLVTADKFDCVLITPGARHCEETKSAETVWVGFRGTRLKGLERRLAPITVVRSPLLTEAVEHLWLVARQQGGAIGPELDALTARLVAMFLRLATEPPMTRASHDWIAAAVAHIENHLIEPLHLPDLAHRFGCSEGHFCRVFRARTGYPPILYILRARIGRAMHLLQHTQWPVAEIGQAVGFDNPFYFSRVFRRFQNCSPLQYRHRLGW
ncbi:MAG: AraC family transcriptional regulator [bacterium]|jgi:AraC-like DNA-binding protein